ncbi:MAG: hypothetical protein EOO20_08620 [Chryseobacterium sp.]|nr:MAG: hypothetical protein EOO20_08620 [Chryseobacterium sp.]
MFYIDQTSAAFQYAKLEHYTNLRYIIRKKLLGTLFKDKHPKGLEKRINKISGIHSSISTFLLDEDNLKTVLIGTPDELSKIKLKFRTKKQIKSIKLLLNYDAFIDTSKDGTFNFYHAYDHAKNMEIPTCVYCNRLYTNTIIPESGEYIARATLDHWFPKSSYPLLALSFYNLIPSCNVCNSSVKGSTKYTLKDIFHPYLKHKDSSKVMDFTISYDLEDHINAQSKFVSKNKFTEESLSAMKLVDIYKVHTEEIRELIYLKKAYPESYLASLQSLLKTAVSSEEVYRLAFGVYLEDEHLIKRPLSKLKKDILFGLGILKPGSSS